MRRSGGWRLWAATVLCGLVLLPALADADRFSTLIEDLGSDRPETYEKARKTLLSSGSRGVPPMVTYLENVLIKEGDRIALLIARLSSSNWKKRERASKELKEIGAASIPALEEAIKSDNPEVSWRAKKALEDISRKDPNEKRQKDRRQLALVRLLSRSGDARALEVLVAGLTAKRAVLRPIAAFGLGLIADVKAADPLIEKLTPATDAEGTPDPWHVRNHAIWALGRMRAKKATEPLLRLADDPKLSPYLRARSIASIRRIIGADANKEIKGRICQRLAARLSDPTWEVRAAAVAALRSLSGKQFEYDYHAPEADRKAGTQAWQAWVEKMPR